MSQDIYPKCRTGWITQDGNFHEDYSTACQHECLLELAYWLDKHTAVESFAEALSVAKVLLRDWSINRRPPPAPDEPSPDALSSDIA